MAKGQCIVEASKVTDMGDHGPEYFKDMFKYCMQGRGWGE
jgi:hypothetical protein